MKINAPVAEAISRGSQRIPSEKVAHLNRFNGLIAQPRSRHLYSALNENRSIDHHIDHHMQCEYANDEWG